MKRLFVASFLSTESKSTIAALKNTELKWPDSTRARWTREDHLHLTWHFLGDVEEAQIATIDSKLDGAIRAISSGKIAVEIFYDQIEYWPNLRRPRLGVVLSSNPPRCVLDLAEEITSACPKLSTSEQKRFRPHITVFRLRTKKSSSIKLDLPDLGQCKFTFISERINQIDLVESDLSSGQPVYKVISTYRL